jgi:hypothetical protein
MFTKVVMNVRGVYYVLNIICKFQLEHTTTTYSILWADDELISVNGKPGTMYISDLWLEYSNG